MVHSIFMKALSETSKKGPRTQSDFFEYAFKDIQKGPSNSKRFVRKCFQRHPKRALELKAIFLKALSKTSNTSFYCLSNDAVRRATVHTVFLSTESGALNCFTRNLLCSRTQWMVCSVAEPMAKEGVLHMVSALPWLATSLKRSSSEPFQ